MKRSKLFLGLTTGLLAIVGVAAAKAHKFTKHRTTGFYDLHGNGCTVSSGDLFYTANSTVTYNQATVFVNPNHFNLYSAYSKPCTTLPLYTGQSPE